MNDLLKTIYQIGVVPVFSIRSPEKAVPVAKALAAGGVPIAQISMQDAGEEAIRAISAQVPAFLVGAGDVVTREQLDRALEAGAGFVSTPGMDPALVEYGLGKGVQMIPGVATGGEMARAVDLGLKAVGFFPAQAGGGAEALRALAGSYRDLAWLPVGGIDSGNMMDYLSCRQVLACGGNWMVPEEFVESERWNDITALCREAVRTMQGLSILHVGINCSSAEEAAQAAKAIALIFDAPYRPMDGADFGGTYAECLKKPGRGQHGHIGLGSFNVDRSIYHMGLRGIRFDETSHSYDEYGRSQNIYLEGEVGGFAVHVLKK